MKQQRFLLITLLVAVLTVPLTIVTGAYSNAIVPEVQNHPLRFGLLVVALAAIVPGVGLWLSRRVESGTKSSAPLKQRERQALLTRVRKRVEKELADSLQGAALQALELRDHPEAVLALTTLLPTQPNAPAQPETSIVHAYEEAEQKLLILGEPGAGKSTLLRQLALYLLTEAEKPGRTLPMPIIFNLSSWAVKRLPLTEWMVEELHTHYQIDPRQGNVWVQDQEILPLLDGWDEVAEAQREACADAINAYLQDHGLVPTVVCSRSQEYWNLIEPHRIKLGRAVEIQPLSQEQITRILKKAGKQLAGLRQALDADEQLRKLMPLPLMLNLMILAYQGMPAKAILQQTYLSDRQQSVLMAYVERRLKERSQNAQFTSENTQKWLAWLARQMTRRNQIEFFLEQLQSDWLPDKRWIKRYQALVLVVFWLVGEVFGAMFFGIIGWLIDGLKVGQGNSLLLFLVMVLVVGPLYFFLLLGSPFEEILPTDVEAWSRRRSKSGLLLLLLFGLLFGLFGGMIPGLILVRILGPVINQDVRLHILAGFSVCGGVFGVLLNGLLGGLQFGGKAVLQHFILRFLLWRTGNIPWQYIRFLDEATRRLLLRKVGSGYVFIHRLVQDYFASLESVPQANSNTEAGS
jgi:energy-coupling factor transporter ATP-binding protein EcfA2